jgi:hypothetical protein
VRPCALALHDPSLGEFLGAIDWNAGCDGDRLIGHPARIARLDLDRIHLDERALEVASRARPSGSRVNLGRGQYEDLTVNLGEAGHWGRALGEVGHDDKFRWCDLGDRPLPA